MLSPLNECSACGSDFTSLKLFDAHRVGKHAYTYSEGIAMEPMREDGRRCLSSDEMLERGWEKDGKGRWFDPIAVEAARQHFRGGTGMPLSASPVANTGDGSPELADSLSDELVSA